MAQRTVALTKPRRRRGNWHRYDTGQKGPEKTLDELLRVEEDHPESIALPEAVGRQRYPESSGPPIQLMKRLEPYGAVVHDIGVPGLATIGDAQQSLIHGSDRLFRHGCVSFPD